MVAATLAMWHGHSVMSGRAAKSDAAALASVTEVRMLETQNSWIEPLFNSDVRRLQSNLLRLVSEHPITRTLYASGEFSPRKQERICVDLAELLFVQLLEGGCWQNYFDCGYTNEEIEQQIYRSEFPKLFSNKKDLDADEVEFLALTSINGTIRLVSLARDGAYKYLDEANNLHHILYVASSETLVLQSAVEELETLINAHRATEGDFQDFFERNPDFILNDEYKKAHRHLVLAQEGESSLIPDFMLEPINQNSMCDLLELKLPSANIFVLKKRRIRFSAAVFEACAQLREYGAFFDEEKNRIAVQERYALLAYKPRMFVIIGRQGSVNPIQLRRMENDIPGIRLRTYDEVVNWAKWRVDNMKRVKLRG